MKNIKFSTRAGAMLLVLVMLTIIPNMKVYSSIGNFATSSQTLDANAQFVADNNNTAQAAWLQAAAEAIALAYGAGYVVGTVAAHVVNAVGQEEEEVSKLVALNSLEFNAYDFSTFDN